MTAAHMGLVFDAEGLDGSEKLLLLAYCNRTDDHGYCWPGQKRLVDDCGTSAATVKRVKAGLIKKGLIASVRRTDPRTGEPVTNLTRVNLDLLAAMARSKQDYGDNVIERLTFASAHDLMATQSEPNPGLNMSPTLGSNRARPRVNMSPPPAQNEPLSLSEPSVNPQVTPHLSLPAVAEERIEAAPPVAAEVCPPKASERDSLPDGFDDFWSRYPRKTAKQDAVKAYRQALKAGASPEQLTAAAEQHAAHWTATCREPRYIPYPASWLRKGSWADDLTTEQLLPTQGAFLIAFDGTGSTPPARRSTTDDRVAAGLALAAEFRALEEGTSA